MEDENEQMSMMTEESPESMRANIINKIQSNPRLKAAYDEAPELIDQAINERIQKKVLERQFRSGAQSSVSQNTADREARRQDALAKARAAQAEIERDFNPDMSSKFDGSAMLKGTISGLGGGGKSVFGESKGIAPAIGGLVSGAGGFLSGGVEGAKQGYVQGRDASQQWIDSGKDSPYYDLGAGVGNTAAILTPGGVATKLPSAVAKIAAGAGTGALFGALNQDTAKQGEIAPIGQTAQDAAIGGAIGGGLTAAGVGAQKLSQSLPRARDMVADILEGKARKKLADWIRPDAMVDDVGEQFQPIQQPTFKELDDFRKMDKPKPAEFLQPQQPMSFKDLESFERKRLQQLLSEADDASMGGTPNQSFDEALAARVSQESEVTANPTLMSKIADLEAEFNAGRDIAEKTQVSRRPPPIAEASLPQRPQQPDIAEAATQAAKQMDTPVQFPTLAPDWKRINMEPRPTVTPKAMSRQPSPPIDVNTPQFEWAVQNDPVMKGMSGTELLSFLNAARSGNTPRAQEIYMQAMMRLGGQ